MIFGKEDGVLPQIFVGGSYEGFDMDKDLIIYGLVSGKSREWGLDQNGNAAEIDVLTETFNVSDIEYLISSDSNDAQKHAAH